MHKINPKLLESKCDANQILQLLIEQNKTIKTFSQDYTGISADFSKWSVAQHIEHLIYTTKTGIFLLLEALDNSKSINNMHKLGNELLTKGAFPLKQTQAPDFSIPKNISHKKLQSSAKRLLSHMQDLSMRADEINISTTTSAHPVLGGFTPRNWLQFIALHQNHHLGIISELTDMK